MNKMANTKKSLAINVVVEHIIESEMGGVIDKEDSYYPTLLALRDLLEKLLDEKEMELKKWE